ncbi:hypothetical protein [Vibrio marisflavi]|uniref:hypothetical protein n=1 Tax=Vibrio marisflavi TaxID=1216040 RepID=UPI001F2F847A|nr:hypothetical protein [Vibrio marisflavi]
MLLQIFESQGSLRISGGFVAAKSMGIAYLIPSLKVARIGKDTTTILLVINGLWSGKVF